MWRWEEHIEAAQRRSLFGLLAWPRFTAEERRLANAWRTCAVGEVRRRFGVSMDRYLAQLGLRFYRAVTRNDVKGAATILALIEDYALASKRRQWEAARGRITREEPALP